METLFINQLLTNIQTVLNGRFNQLKTCKVFSGRFDIEMLKSLSTRLPALYVSLLNVPKQSFESTGELGVDLNLAIYVITKNDRSDHKDKDALNIVEGLFHLLNSPAARWNLSGVDRAIDIRADNLFSSNVKKYGMAMWGVAWQQRMMLGDNIWDSNDFLPTELYGALENDDHELITAGANSNNE